jgi:hypothetical protein
MAATYSYGSAPTYTKIASTTYASAASAYTFSNIPQQYTDLILVTNTRAQTGQASYDIRIYINLNGDQTSGLYSGTVMHGTGVNAISYRETGRNQVDNSKQTSTQSSGEFAPFIYNIMNYSNPNIFKNVIERTSTSLNTEATYNGPGVSVVLWRNLNPVTSLTVQSAGGASNGFAAGSTLTLYGIKQALVPKAEGGDIRTDGTYWIHTFTNSGSFIPRQNLTVDYLVVAGGGASGGNSGSVGGGGGGAGGLRSTVTATGGGGTLESALSLSASTGYTVTVGAGGSGVGLANNGSNSTFSSITSTGGGRGAEYVTNATGAGGSGGGGVYGYITGGAASPSGQGYAGGSYAGNNEPGAGGGGAGAVGQTVGNGGVGGNGGAGVAVAISGSSVTYAGGGGGGTGSSGTATGGTGGSGGGGNGGGSSGVGSNGTANTGGGAGGAGGQGGVAGSRDGGSGGSGIVIVRYAV